MYLMVLGRGVKEVLCKYRVCERDRPSSHGGVRTPHAPWRCLSPPKALAATSAQVPEDPARVRPSWVSKPTAGHGTSLTLIQQLSLSRSSRAASPRAPAHPASPCPNHMNSPLLHLGCQTRPEDLPAGLHPRCKPRFQPQPLPSAGPPSASAAPSFCPLASGSYSDFVSKPGHQGLPRNMPIHPTPPTFLSVPEDKGPY